MSNKVAFITGVTGQDGSYLAKFLLQKDYIVCGLRRRSSSVLGTERIDDIIDHPNFKLYYGDITDPAIGRIIQAIEPDEIYNLAAQSHVHVSFDSAEYTANVDGIGALRILETMRQMTKPVRFYQASTSEMFGKVQEIPQKETTPFYPRSPYGVAKLYAHWITKNFREAYGLHASSGILFNHESPHRGEQFVTKKITTAVAKIKAGMQDCLRLGNLDTMRDWGHAKEFVEGMWLILQRDVPDDYVMATGRVRSVRDFATMAFSYADMPIEFEGEGADEIGKCIKTGKVVLRIDPALYRPAEVDFLLGDPSKAKDILGWEAKIPVEELCREMVEFDLARFIKK